MIFTLDSVSAKLDSTKQSTQSAVKGAVDATKSAAETAANKSSQIYADTTGSSVILNYKHII